MNVKEEPNPSLVSKIFIVPHAGYKYSGLTAAYGYKALAHKKWKRVVLLGPSHRGYLKHPCELCPFKRVATPFGPLEVDDIDKVPLGSPNIDLNEHSLEIQYPFIKAILPDSKVVPILVGNIHGDLGKDASVLVASLLSDSDTALVISSDFCHWGENYSYKPDLRSYDGGTMSERITSLDRQAMNLITDGNVEAFCSYLSSTKNTICGRNPIILGMRVINQLGLKGHWQWLNYSQSYRITDHDSSSKESSVSYVSGAFVLHD